MSKLHEQKSAFPYSHYWAKSQVSLDLCKRLGDLLPHGSGINGSWHVERKDNRLFYASNHYEAMDENGFYCHDYSFTAVYKFNGDNQFEPCKYCNNTGKRYIRDFIKYHPNQFPMQVIEWLVAERDTLVNWDIPGNTESAWFTCNVCDGLGKIGLKPFEFMRLNWHGQREYTCCGYSLREYLTDSLTI